MICVICAQIYCLHVYFYNTATVSVSLIRCEICSLGLNHLWQHPRNKHNTQSELSLFLTHNLFKTLKHIYICRLSVREGKILISEAMLHFHVNNVIVQLLVKKDIKRFQKQSEKLIIPPLRKLMFSMQHHVVAAVIKTVPWPGIEEKAYFVLLCFSDIYNERHREGKREKLKSGALDCASVAQEWNPGSVGIQDHFTEI